MTSLPSSLDSSTSDSTSSFFCSSYGKNGSTCSSLPSLDTVQQLPKVELHAHLFGCIRLEALKDIQTKRREPESSGSSSSITDGRLSKVSRNIDDAFTYFEQVYRIIQTPQDVRTICDHVIQDFQQDNVVYLELRTSLKSFPEHNMSTEDYAQIIYQVAQDHSDKIVVRLLLSIDRAKLISRDRAMQELEAVFRLARKYTDFIVGVDIAGNPKKGNLSYVLSDLKSRIMDENGEFHNQLKLTIHTAEVPSESTEEVDEILSLRPHRIGHGCFLTEVQLRVLEAGGIYVEMCPSSNLTTMELKDIRDHHFGCFWARESRKGFAVICTDDTGLFRTNLSKELHLMSQAFSLSAADLKRLQYVALEASFAPQDLKDRIKDILDSTSVPNNRMTG